MKTTAHRRCGCRSSVQTSFFNMRVCRRYCFDVQPFGVGAFRGVRRTSVNTYVLHHCLVLTMLKRSKAWNAENFVIKMECQGTLFLLSLPHSYTFPSLSLPTLPLTIHSTLPPITPQSSLSPSLLPSHPFSLPPSLLPFLSACSINGCCDFAYSHDLVHFYVCLYILCACVRACVGGCVCACVGVWVCGWVGACVCGWVGGWVGGWVRARVHACQCVCYFRAHRSYLSKIKNVKIAFIDIDVRHRMAPLRMLHSVTLTSSLKVKYLKCYYLGNGDS